VLKTSILCTIIATLCLGSGTAFANEEEDHFLQKLDAWVAAGGDRATIPTEVHDACELLTIITADASERLKLKTTDRREFEFRQETCIKMTVNRAHPRPKFIEREEIMSLCEEESVPLFPLLCRQSGLID
jgi:hypothetical protein